MAVPLLIEAPTVDRDPEAVENVDGEIPVRGDDAAALERAAKLAEERERLLAALASGSDKTFQEKIAWLLNTQPETRDSDISLQIAYWKEYEADLYEQFRDDPEQTYRRLTRHASVARARAKIQNQFRLFLATDVVRKRRGQMSEEERERHANDEAPAPTIVVYADESGKTDTDLLIGSVWFVNPEDTWKLARYITGWKVAKGLDLEFHYSTLSRDNLPVYRALVDLVFDQIPLISFKSIRVPRQGIRAKDEAFEWMLTQLLIRGVEHEDANRRATLPRRIAVYKDQEAQGQGRDKLIVSKVKEALIEASANRFNNQLRVEHCEALDSKDQPLLQLADLFTGSLNRVLVRGATSDHHKDQFADYLLERIQRAGGISIHEDDAAEGIGDLQVDLRL
ncbi:MAG TPA: DUF3800 domain-containing protein [Gemmatimonadaceae bacterium]|nr:DUF3800 domain-containing protein [Gemmatimonadaceae bacterium]